MEVGVAVEGVMDIFYSFMTLFNGLGACRAWYRSGSLYLRGLQLEYTSRICGLRVLIGGLQKIWQFMVHSSGNRVLNALLMLGWCPLHRLRYKPLEVNLM